jgi:hypothetical protein
MKKEVVCQAKKTIFCQEVDTFDGAKPRLLNRGKKRRSVSTLSIPRASDRESKGLITDHG